MERTNEYTSNTFSDDNVPDDVTYGPKQTTGSSGHIDEKCEDDKSNSGHSLSTKFNGDEFGSSKDNNKSNTNLTSIPTPINSRRSRSRHSSGNNSVHAGNRLSESVSEIVQRFLGNHPNPSFNALTRDSPERSSTSSFDLVQLNALAEERFVHDVPGSDGEMRSFIIGLVSRYKKRSQLTQALDLTWLKVYASSTQVGPSEDTVLHIATRMGDRFFVSALLHSKPPKIDIDIRNENYDTALHLASSLNDSGIIEILLKHGASVDLINKKGLTAIQIAAMNGFVDVITLLLNKGSDYTRIARVGGSLLTLACFGIHRAQLKEEERLHEEVEEDSQIIDRSELLNRTLSRSRDTSSRDYPILDHLLNLFEKQPKLVLVKDNIGTSAGTPLHYFAILNFVKGVDRLLRPPFNVPVDLCNDNGITALSIAAWKGFWGVGELLLEKGADANPPASDTIGVGSPLHSVIYGYHVSRAEATTKFVDKLIKQGANAELRNAAGETPAHLAVKTTDFGLISRFIDYLGEECLSLADESGNTLFHYAVSTLDEDCIHSMIEKGADLMTSNQLQLKKETNVEEDVFDHDDNSVAENETERNGSFVRRLPVQEAMRHGNSQQFFNALARCDLRFIVSKLQGREERDRFIAMHLVAASKEVRSDIVRRLFLLLKDQDLKELHSILLFSDPLLKDKTYTKTALQWAVENDDRFCTTEILHQEYKCHSKSKVSGLCCLRSQIHGDELLSWTIETFTLLYDRTWAQRNILPLMHIFPLIFSIFAFIYDYYSDFELCKVYFDRSDLPTLLWNATSVDNMNSSPKGLDDEPCTLLNSTHALISLDKLDEVIDCNLFNVFMASNSSNKRNEPFTSMSCVDLQRTPSEYRTAFLVNFTSIFIPVVVFYLMCVRELTTHIRLHSSHSTFVRVLLTIGSVFISVPLAPLFILYVACVHIVVKFKHRGALKKSIYRRKLQRIEYLWGIARTSEAGLESCLQIILQMWMLSSHFRKLAYDDLGDLADQTVNGLIFFLSFSIRKANEVEKSLGKMAMALIFLVLGVSSCYRTLKRGAVRIKNTAFIFLSLLLQIVARMGAIGIFFFAFRDFYPIVIVLAVHFFAVFVLKWSFERVRHTRGVMAWLASVINVFASSLVFVRVMPIERSSTGIEEEDDSDDDSNDDSDDDGMNYSPKRKSLKKTRPRFHVATTKSLSTPSSLALEHSTFFIQSLFFALVIVENLVLSLTPFFRPLASDRPLDCLGEATLIRYCVIIALIHMASWIPHCLFYKYMGHPWADINGPFVDCNPFRFKFHVHFRGQEKVVGLRPDDNFNDDDYSNDNGLLMRQGRSGKKRRLYCIDYYPEEDEELYLHHLYFDNGVNANGNKGDRAHSNNSVVDV